MELTTIQIVKPEAINVILGQSHFIKTIEDIHEALINAVPGIQFGLAFCEASACAAGAAGGFIQERGSGHAMRLLESDG